MAAKLKEREEVDFYKNLFRMLDKKNNGFITCDHLRYILQGLAKEVDLTEEEIEDMIADIDEDKNGEVSFEGECPSKLRLHVQKVIEHLILC